MVTAPVSAGVGQHAHRGEGDRVQLLGALHAVEEPREGPERVVDGEADVPRLLELLQYGVGHTCRECVTGEQERRHAVGRCKSGTREHVRGTGADRGGRGECRPAAVHACVPDGLMHHGLLIPRLIIGHQIGLIHVELFERLTDAGDVPVAENAEHAGDGPLTQIPIHGPLVAEEPDQRLADRHPLRRHQRAPSLSSIYGRRGSTSCPFQV